MKLRDYTAIITDAVLLTGILIFMMAYFDTSYLFYDTIVTGGDTASWYGMADHMLKVLLPNCRMTGWDMGNFCGYPNFTFYFIPPFLMAVLPSYLFGLPLAITLKLTIMTGVFLLPVMTYFGLRAMRYDFPIPVVGAGASLLFLFNESYTMFGGNTLSTFAGEFCYMFAFALFAYFIGSLYRGIETESGAIKNGILLGLIGLSHLFVFIPAVFLLVYWFFEKGRVRYLLKVCLIAFGLMAFWILPLMAYRHPYTTPVYMIWQEFVSWRYTLTGIGIVLLFLGPRLTLCAIGQLSNSRPFWKGWDLSMLCFSGIGSFVFFYLIAQYSILGKSMWATGLKTAGVSASPLGANLAGLLNPMTVPVCIAMSMTVVGTGLWVRRKSSDWEKFCRVTGTTSFLTGLFLAITGLYVLICDSIDDPALRSVFLNKSSVALFCGIIMLSAGWILFFSKRFRAFIQRIANGKSDRFRMFLWLGFGCIVGYFSAHFLKIPDIRFLPPLLFVLILIFFADTLDQFFSLSGLRTKTAAAVGFSYLCILVVIFGATKSDVWFRYNNKGYENRPGYNEFIKANNYLKTTYKGQFKNPLNAPRVGYEKCDAYDHYGGDRVFESLPLFSGRQTMEGIHYASSIASKCISFLQTEYSRDIKTPRPYILSKMNPDALPAHLDLYNISQLILMTDKAKKAIEASSLFEKEKVLGPISIYRYKDCNNLYVDVPAIRPVIYTGKDWMEDFFQWYRYPDRAGVLLVPKDSIRDAADRAVFSNETARVTSLSRFRKDTLDKTDLKIETDIEHLKIRFTTNRVGLPHLVKVSYFPNWQVKGANGVYPVSPHLMLVVPRNTEVVLTYERSMWESVGMGLTTMTLITLFFMLISRTMTRRPRTTASHLPSQGSRSGGGALSGFCRLSETWDILIARPMERLLIAVRPYLLVLVLLTAFGLVICGAMLRNKPVRAYVGGYSAYKIAAGFSKAPEQDAAGKYYKKAIRIMEPIIEKRQQFDHQDVIHCILYTARSFEGLGQWDRAEALYRSILADYPYSRYVGEAYVMIGRIQKQGRNRNLDEGLKTLRQGDAASGLLFIRKAIDQTLEGLNYFKMAREKDPASVWAEYALRDINTDREYFKKKQDIIYSLCDRKEVRKAIASILD